MDCFSLRDLLGSPAYSRAGIIAAVLLLVGGTSLLRAQTITALQPESGASGTSVRIYGSGFGATPRENTVRFADVTAPVDSVGDGVLYARVPSGISGVVSVSVTVGGSTGAAAQRFSVVTGGGGRFAPFGAGIAGVQYGDADLGDVNGDGRLDLVVVGSDGSAPATTLYINQGGGDFTVADAGLVDVTGRDGTGASVVFGDVDNDGALDLLVVGSDGSIPTATLYLNDGAGNFSPAGVGIEGVTNSSADMGDVDNDGDLDLVLTGMTSDNLRTTMLYTNQGGGDFIQSDVQLRGVSAGTSTFGDVDNDGDLDLLVTGRSVEDSYSTTLYKNDGSGNFTVAETDLPAVARGSADFGDVDADGDLDLVLTGEREEQAGSAMLFENDGTGTFTPTRELPAGVALGSSTFGDFDGDGATDLVLTGRDGTSTPTTLLYRNAGEGSFSLHTDSLTAVEYSTSEWGDLDGDGTLDLVVTGNATGDGGPTATLYQNGGEFVPPAIGVDSSALTDTLAVGESRTQSIQIENIGSDSAAAALQFNAFVTASDGDSTSTLLRATGREDEWPPPVETSGEPVSFSPPGPKSHSDEPPLFLDDPVATDTATVNLDQVRMGISGEQINVVLEHAQPVDTSNYAFSLSFDVDQDTSTGVEYQVVGADLGSGGIFLSETTSDGTVTELPVAVDSSAVHFSVPLSFIEGTLPMNVSGAVGTSDYPSDWFPNQGSAPLGSVEWLSLSPTSGSLDPGASVEMEATMTTDGLPPDTTVHGAIHILSNDPLQGSVEVPVTLRVKGEAVLSARRDSVEIGRGQVGTNASEVRLVFENTGSGEATGLTLALDNRADYAILDDTGEETLPPGSTRTARIAFHPEEAGTGQTAAVTLTSAVGTQATTVLTGAGVDAQVTTQTDGEAAPRGEPIGISVTPQGPFEPTRRRLYARQGGEQEYQVQPDSSQIAEALVTRRGVDYYVVLQEGDFSIVVPGGTEAAAQDDPFHMPVSFTEWAAPFRMPPQSYRMISVPARPEEGIRSALETAYGAYNPAEWRLMRWAPSGRGEGAEGGYREYPQLDSLRPGQGLWLVTSGADSLTVGKGRTVDASGPQTIVLAPGWTQIGNPFGFAVPWSAVRAASGIDSTQVGAPVGYRTGEGYRYGEPVLSAWEGYFVYNRGSQPDTLVVPPVGVTTAEGGVQQTRGRSVGPEALAGTGRLGAPARRPALQGTAGQDASKHGAEYQAPSSGAPSAAASTGRGTEGSVASSGQGASGRATQRPGYTLRVGAWPSGSGGGRPHRVWLGLRPEAREGVDALDFAQAPPIGRSVRLSVRGDERGASGTGRWAGSFKPPAEEGVPSVQGRSWPLVVSNQDAEAPQTVQLRVKTQGHLPEGQRRYLLDLDRERRMVAGRELVLEPGETRRLKVVVGTEAYARDNSEGISVEEFSNELRGNYPNPFGGETTIEYVLADPQEVTVQVYNVLGQRVRTLVDGKKKAGRHAIRWEGQSRYGQPVGSGVYFYRIEATDFTETRKMVLVR